MQEEITQRGHEALAVARVKTLQWGHTLRADADKQLGRPCRDEEFAELWYGAAHVLVDAQHTYDNMTGLRRSREEYAYLPERTLPWAEAKGVEYAKREIAEYLENGGPHNKEWCWESRKDTEGKYIGGSFERISATLDTLFDSGPCQLEAHDARNKELIRWSESDDPEAVKVREYAATLRLFAPAPADECGNIGYTPCVMSAEVVNDKYGTHVRAILPFGLKWGTFHLHSLMELMPEAGPPRFFGDNNCIGSPEKNGIYDIYKYGVNAPPYFKMEVGLRVKQGNKKGVIVKLSNPWGCGFVKWDNKEEVDYGMFGDWYWWWHLQCEVTP